MSGVKSHLRKARESVASKNYKDALLHCKNALSDDRDCYEAYV